MRLWFAAGLMVVAQTALAQLGGTLSSVGSDTLGGLMTRWAETFRHGHPDVIVQVQTPGSGSAPTALSEGAADFGAMSRPMRIDEERRFQQRFGYPPARIVVALDAIVVFVHPDNSLRALSLAEVGATFSKNNGCTPSSEIERWQMLGVTSVDLAPQRILRIGRNGSSGTYEFFRDAALCGGSYRDDVVQFPGAGAVVAAVAQYPNAIGYAGIGYVNALVRPLALSASQGNPAVSATAQEIRSGNYPLSRPLYIYYNQAPGTSPKELPLAFLEFVLSDLGQAIVEQEGFVAVPTLQLQAQRNTLHGPDSLSRTSP
jgi:phosphate transport system substrate-binding protein